MKMTLTKTRPGFWCLCGILLNGCSEQLPSVPGATPSYKPFLATVEYERPAWSPDGRDLFFDGGPSEHFRVYRTSRTGGELRDVLNQLHCGNAAISWAHKRIAYNVYHPNVSLEIWTANLDGSSRHQVTSGGHHGAPEWSPDGSQISFLSFPDCTANIVPAQGGEVRSIGASLSPAVWSPTGEYLALIQGEQSKGYYQLNLISLADGSRRTLQSTVATNMPGDLFNRMGLRFDWSPDGRRIVWPVLVDGHMQLVLVDVGGDNIPKRLPTEGFASDPRFSPDGRWIAYASEASGHPRGIRVISTDGEEDLPVTTPAQFPKGELIRYASTGGLQIPSFIFRPAGERKTRRPAIVWLHGGGAVGAILDRFDQAIQYFVANGFVVLAPNYRPSRGFGPELATAGTGEDIADDVAAAAAYLKQLDEVDPARIAVLGASFGGYAVLRTITAHPDLFAAAVDLNGPCDLTALFRKIPAHRPIMAAMLGGTPEQQAERYREESPLTHADRIATPLLVIHGTADETVPCQQSQALVTALSKAGKPHEFISYRGVGHGFPPPVWANAMEHSMAFILRELHGQAGGALAQDSRPGAPGRERAARSLGAD